jgi:flagellar assembly factor FliW
MKVAEACDPTTELKMKSKDAVIHFEEGLIGFSEYKDFVLMENEGLAPFRLLQSLDSPEVGFLVLETSALVNNFNERVPTREWEALGVKEAVKPLAFAIVVLGQTPQTTTGNLQAPLLINYEKMIGKQVILSESGFSVRHPLV